MKLFAVGLFGASALAGAVVPLSTAYALSEAIGVERSVSRRFAEAPLFLSLFTGQVVIGAAVALAPGNLIDLLIKTQVLNGLITPIILCLHPGPGQPAQPARCRRPTARSSGWWRPSASSAVSTMSAIVVVQTVLPWLGLSG